MCRISALIDFGNKDNAIATVRRMNSAMYRGGPDDEGIFMDEVSGVVFGHRRLSVIDVSADGHQPMSDASENYVITYNGEIYNYKELRAELEGEGYRFRTASDTEVLLNGYAAWGTSLFAKLKGMYAFVLLDKAKKNLVAARDHAGIKPLYYGQRGSSFYFSSEVRGLKAADAAWPEDPDWPIYFLSFGSIPEPHTTLEGVKQLPKGKYLVYDLQSKEYRINAYQEFRFTSTLNSVSAATAAIRDSVNNAVKRHLIADVATGVFLSGGVDSSILTIAAGKFQEAPIKTLSVYFDDSDFSEKPYQDMIVKQTGAMHHSFKVTGDDLENELPEIMEALDQPSIDGINSYFICKYAKEYGLKVVLSGLGADELFGGYKSFADVRFRRLERIRSAVLLASTFFSAYPVRKLQFFKRGRGSLNQYFFHRGLFVPADVAAILGINIHAVNAVLTKLEEGLVIPDHAEGLNRQCFLEENMYMQNQLLKDSDRLSMWHGIELRVPFLDKDVIETAYAVDPEIKFDGVLKKHLLIKAFEDVLPSAIWKRQKMGFSFPFENWLQKSSFCNIKKEQDPLLQQAYSDFEKGSINWSRYWSRFVHRNFQTN